MSSKVLVQNIKRLLDMSPRGASGEQLAWRLRRSGMRADPPELLTALETLLRGGEIEHLHGVWRARRPRSTEPAAHSSSPHASGLQPDDVPPPASIPAVHARIVPKAPPQEDDLDPIAEPAPAVADWDRLLAYFAATQRQDARGRIAEFPDRHANGWLLFEAQGRWWREAELSIEVAAMPAAAPEALSRRGVRTAALGWPIGVLDAAEGPTILPGLMLPAEWELDSGELRIRPTAERPALNPLFLREATRRTRWREDDLVEVLLPPGEADDLAAVAERMRSALATLGGRMLRPGELGPRLEFGAEGLRNAAGLFLPDDASFTKGAADDLERLRAWSPEARRETSLGALLEATGREALPEGPVAATGPLTDAQFEAVDAALSAPLTLVQGPPGTGKSEVILSLIATAVLTGRSVLFSARNHQALDEVERRLQELAPEAQLMVRARDATGERNATFLDALGEIADGHSLPSDAREGAELRRSAFLTSATDAAIARRRAGERRTLRVALSDLAERAVLIRERLGDARPRLRPHRSRGFWGRLLARLGLRRRQTGDLLERVPDDAPLAAIEGRLERLRDALATLDADGDVNLEPLEAPGNPSDALRDALSVVAPAVATPDEATRLALDARRREIAFEPSPSLRAMTEDDARAVLQHRPVWAVGTLSAPTRIPLIPALFDLVIFDEASQCDIASALPLLARARRAAIVGDPRQLGFIPGLGIGAEHALMDAVDLPRAGRAAIAQSRNSLFAFAQGRPGVRRFFLADQFRSAPGIVQWLGEEFYEGRLVGRRDEDGFRTPKGWRPGLAWEDVQGRACVEGGGTVNEAEAERVVDVIVRLAADESFEGSVGVVTPVNAQVALIQTLLSRRLDEAARQRFQPLRISTADRWQGGEADVILFSPVLAPGAPASLRAFLQRERRRLNVAVSRARALCLVVGNLDHVRGCGVRPLERLAERATGRTPPPRPPFDSLWERRVDAAMRARGLEPIPQFPVGHRFLDFALDPEGAKVNVEVDGRRWHLGPDGSRKVEDRLRDAELRTRGWRVLRFWVHELAEDMERCLDDIERELRRPRADA